MQKHTVSLVSYEKPFDSVRKAVELVHGFDHLKPGTRVFIKPNIVLWIMDVLFPKWGVNTTCRVMEDIIVLLKERGIDDITIGEGVVTVDPKDRTLMQQAYHTMGYDTLKKRYGIKYFDIFDTPFQKVELDDDMSLNFSVNFLESDFVVNLPVLKTHCQSVVSLSIKNLKGLLDLPSRKKCHSIEPGKDLHCWISKLIKAVPPSFTLIDGIYVNEQGPLLDGKLHRKNVLIASNDFLSADFVGARVLGYQPSEVPHLAYVARDKGRSTDLDDIEIIGETLEQHATRKYEYAFSYNEEGTLPLFLHEQGIKGLSYREYDISLCTYCSYFGAPLTAALQKVWRGIPFDDVEILTGKVMTPTPGKNMTILIGKCIYEKNKDNPDINHLIEVKGCPPKPDDIVEALHEAGIPINPMGLVKWGKGFKKMYAEYIKRPEFDENFFTVQ